MLKLSFAFFPLLYLGIKVYGKLNMGDISIHWNSLPVLFYVLSYYFTHIFVPFTNSSNPHAPTLVSDIFVEAGLQH